MDRCGGRGDCPEVRDRCASVKPSTARRPPRVELEMLTHRRRHGPRGTIPVDPEPRPVRCPPMPSGKIDLHTHILPERWPNLRRRYRVRQQVALEAHGPCCARMHVDGRFFRQIELELLGPECPHRGVRSPWRRDAGALDGARPLRLLGEGDRHPRLRAVPERPHRRRLPRFDPISASPRPAPFRFRIRIWRSVNSSGLHGRAWHARHRDRLRTSTTGT